MPKDARKSVLVVDDDPSVLKLVSLMLAGAGYRVLEASDGKQAVVRFQEDPTDLLLTDVIMPEQEGVETLSRLMRDYPRLKTIAMSGAARGRYLRVAGMVGAHAVLRKPFTKEDLLQTVERVLR